MKTVEEYKALITSWHASRPKFRATVEADVEPLVDIKLASYEMIDAFDLDKAIGKQLDILGQWIGRSREVSVPVADLWFSLDNERKGFDKGIWKGPYDAATGIKKLDDESYRRLLRAKIIFNSWDGTILPAEKALRDYFNAPDTLIFIEDRMDMSVAICMVGKWPFIVDLIVLEDQYIPAKACGVKTYYQVASIEDTPLFGFDLDTPNIAGWDTGCWGVTPRHIVANLL